MKPTLLVALMLLGCLLGGCSWRDLLGLPEPPASAPVVPAKPDDPPRPPPTTDSSPAEREAYYRDEVVRLSAKLEAAKGGLDAAREQARYAEERTWAVWTRWIGLVGTIAAVGIGGVLTWAAGPRIGLPVGAIIAAMALAVVGYGASLRWLPLALGVSLGGGGLLWLLYHMRHLRVAVAGSRVVDALEREGAIAVREAKQGLGSALDQAGLRPRFDRLRRAWGGKDPQPTDHA